MASEKCKNKLLKRKNKDAIEYWLKHLERILLTNDITKIEEKDYINLCSSPCSQLNIVVKEEKISLFSDRKYIYTPKSVALCGISLKDSHDLILKRDSSIRDQIRAAKLLIYSL